MEQRDARVPDLQVHSARTSKSVDDAFRHIIDVHLVVRLSFAAGAHSVRVCYKPDFWTCTPGLWCETDLHCVRAWAHARNRSVSDLSFGTSRATHQVVEDCLIDALPLVGADTPLLEHIVFH